MAKTKTRAQHAVTRSNTLAGTSPLQGEAVAATQVRHHRDTVKIDLAKHDPSAHRPTPAPQAGSTHRVTRSREAAERSIRVRGAREHNLKDIDVDIPRDQLVVITGLSGSGKSSLAFDTIFAEGQRKYMESLSAYARQFLDQLKKPDVDDIEGLPPTIAIEQRSGTSNPRSTVATTTEIYDYLRLLFARCGKPVCWAPTVVKKDGTVSKRCGLPIQATASTQIVDAVMASLSTPTLRDGSLGTPSLGEGSTASATQRILVLAPVARDKKGFHRDILEDLQKQGWTRARVNGTLHEIRDVLAKGGENPLGLGRYEKHNIDIVVDRLVLKAEPEVRQRLAESVESALKAADGTVIISFDQTAAEGSKDQKKGIEAPRDKGIKASEAPPSSQLPSPTSQVPTWTDRVFSNKHSCAVHPECSLPELSPRLFSFNSHLGACAECHGLGVIMEFDEELVVPDQSKTLAEGAIKPWKVPPPMGRFFRKRLKAFCELTGTSQSKPYSTLSTEHRRMLMFGTTPADIKGKKATFEGVAATLKRWYERSESAFIKEWLGQFMREKMCPTCCGDRLRMEALSVLLNSSHKADKAKAFSGAVIPRAIDDGSQLNIAELSRLTIVDALDFMQNFDLSAEQRVIAEPIIREVGNRLGFLVSVGLEYLSLDRKTGTLSGGEAQRIRLATQVGSKLVGACYVLDEPTIGLHQRDNSRLIRTLRHLADIGNTVLVVEHDEDMIRSADYVLDIGPGPGVHGGRVVAQGTVDQIIAETLARHQDGPDASRQWTNAPWNGRPARSDATGTQTGGTPVPLVSLTGEYLAGLRRIEVPAPSKRRKLSEKNAILIKGARENNLKNIDIAIPLGGLVCVTGVSGSGKSTLVNDILLSGLKKHLHGSRERVGAHAKMVGINKIDRVIEVDQSPIGRTPRSNAATYTGIFDEIRKIYASTKESKIRGYKVGRFSFNVKSKSGGGRCEACEGQGLKKIEMHFLPDVFVGCEICSGSRFNRETLEITYRGKSVADVLKMTVESACEFFENHPKILRFVRCLRDVGLEYIELGQPSTTLSGGEAQRVKLATELGKGGGTKNNPVLEPGSNTDLADDEGRDDGAESPIDDDDDDEGVQATASRPSALGHTLYVLDEPTTGLHFEDVRKLVTVLNRLADSGGARASGSGGNTLVVIEHNLDVIKCADWIIDLGPEGGDKGGTIIASGTPEHVASVPASHTGHYLAQMLGQR